MYRTAARLRQLLVPAALLLTLTLGVGASVADDAADTAHDTPEALLGALEAARNAGDPKGIGRAFQALPGVYAKAARKDRRRLVRGLDACLDSGLHGVPRAALKLLVALDDGELAWKESLRRRLPKEEVEELGPWDREILSAVYLLHPDEAIRPLLQLVKKATLAELTSSALRVLGGYELSRKRVQVLEELVKIITANLPGKGDSKNPRIVAIAAQLPQALNDLTGQRYSLKQWSEVWRTMRKHPERLFVRPLPKRTRSR